MITNYANPMVRRAYDVLKKISLDEETRIRAEMRERALKDEVSMLWAAEKKGEKKGIDKGEVIGNIRMGQRVLGLPLISKEELAGKTSEELESLLARLESDLKMRDM